MQEITALSDLVAKYGVLPLLLIAVVGVFHEWRAAQKECRRWQKLALSLMGEAEKGVALAEFYRGAE